jgi:hypothetical protein
MDLDMGDYQIGELGRNFHGITGSAFNLIVNELRKCKRFLTKIQSAKALQKGY